MAGTPATDRGGQVRTGNFSADGAWGSNMTLFHIVQCSLDANSHDGRRGPEAD